MLDRLRAVASYLIAAVLFAVGIVAGSFVTAHFKNAEITRLDAALKVAVQEGAKLEQAQADARVESARMATRWTENVNANKVKSDSMVAAMVVDRDRLALRVRELTKILAEVRRDPIAAASLPASAVDGDAASTEFVDGAQAGRSLEDYAQECELLRIGLIDAQQYLGAIGAMKLRSSDTR